MKREIIKTIALLFITSLIVSGIYLAYFFSIGIPKTQARNYFNLSQKYLEEGNTLEARNNLEKAYSFWPEEYIQIELDRLLKETR